MTEHPISIVDIRPTESGMEIHFIDNQRQSKNVNSMSIYVIDERVEDAAQIMSDIIEAARDLVTLADDDLRNPPRTLPPR